MNNVQSYYDTHSSEYVEKWDLSEDGIRKPANYYRLEIINSIIKLASIKPGDRVVEIGCGTGLVLKELLKITKPVYGTDISREMLERAKSYIGDEVSNVILTKNDILELNLPKNYFDKIISMEVLRYVEDMPKALINVKRIMKNNSTLVFTVTNVFSFSFFPLKYYVRKLFHMIDTKTELSQYFVTECRIKKEIKKSGLEIISFKKLNLLSFNPVVKSIVHTRTGAKNIVRLDAILSKIPIIKNCFDTFILAVKLKN